MKRFAEKKGITQKIIITIIFVMLFNFIVPNISIATNKSDDEKETFGILFKPIQELLLGVTDAVMWGIQYIVLGQKETFTDFAKNEMQYSGGLGVSVPVAVQTIRLPKFNIDPEKIFSNKVPLLDVNFFNPQEAGTTKSSASELRPIISKWYYALRNFAIVMLLCILVYIGIRIIISSSSKEQAKYKQHLMDWLVAMCLIFFMHYIMSFAVTLTEEITKAVSSENSPYNISIKYNEDENSKYYYTLDGERYDSNAMEWETDLMGRTRIELQIGAQGTEQKLLKSFGFTVIYMGLVMYTVLFLFRYLKRLLMLTFLTIIAPLMAMTYPLDKLHDNKAQGFNMWLKEYIFNLLIQPVHLILYTVLIGTSMEFAGNNILYSLVAFGFMLQAEKIMKRFFGFDSASTVSNTSAALGGALAVKGIEAISKRLGKSGKNDNKKEDNKKITQANRKPTKDINELMNNALGAEVLTSTESLNPIEEEQNNNQYEGNTPAYTPTDSRPNSYEPNEDNNNFDKEDSQQGDNEESLENNQNDENDDNPDNYDKDENADGQEDDSNSKPPIRKKNNSQYKQDTNSNDNTIRFDRNIGASIDELLQDLDDISSDNKPTLTLGQRALKHVSYIGPKLALGAGKGILKAGLMATGGVIGLTAGLVSDDFSNVTKYGAAGIGAGYIAGNGIPNKISSIKEKISNAYDKEYRATHTKAEINERLDRKALQDKERITKYQEEFNVTKAEAKQLMIEAQQYREYGVTNDDIIIKAMKMKELGKPETTKERTSKQRILLAKMASQVDGKEENYKRLKEGLKDRGISNKASSKYLRAIRMFNDWI